MPEKNYFVKIIFLCLATLAGIFAIWYALIREQSADWITAQVVHQISPYVVFEASNGRTIVENVVIGYEFSLPQGFKTTGARNLSLVLGADARKECEIRHYVVKANGAGKLSAGPGRRIIPWRQESLVFELANQKEMNNCAKDLLEIKNNLAADWD